MPCGCSNATKYQANRPDGSSMEYRTRSEAEADVLRNGGTVTTVG